MGVQVTAQRRPRWSVPKAHVYRLARDERIPAVRLGRYVRFDPDAIRDFERGAQTPRGDPMKKELVQPVAGATFELAAKVHVNTPDRRKLLLLLAGYADAGEHSPAMAELTRRVGVSPAHVDAMLDNLVKAGLLEVQWAGNSANPPGRRLGPKGARNVYTLVIDNIAEAA